MRIVSVVVDVSTEIALQEFTAMIAHVTVEHREQTRTRIWLVFPLLLRARWSRLFVRTVLLLAHSAIVNGLFDDLFARGCRI